MFIENSDLLLLWPSSKQDFNEWIINGFLVSHFAYIARNDISRENRIHWAWNRPMCGEHFYFMLRVNRWIHVIPCQSSKSHVISIQTNFHIHRQHASIRPRRVSTKKTQHHAHAFCDLCYYYHLLCYVQSCILSIKQYYNIIIWHQIVCQCHRLTLNFPFQSRTGKVQNNWIPYEWG